MRLDKYLALSGFGTRSEVKKLIKSGVVTVDGVIRGANYHVDGDVYVNGKLVIYEEFKYYMMNKPKGYVTAKSDSTHPFLGSLVSEDVSFVGRLDKDTEGLLLLTNDGALLHKLTNPKYNVPKTYLVEVSNVFKPEYKKTLENGLKMKKTSFLPAKVNIITNTLIELTITEGKYHQVKRMMAYFNLEVLSLKRISFGNIKLDETLNPGKYRPLTKEEINILKNNVFV